MHRHYFFVILSLIFLSFEVSSSCFKNFTQNPVAYSWSLVKCHPFITAAVIVVALNKEPLECIKETISYFLEEHPILCIILLGLIISGSFSDLSHILETTVCHAIRACSSLMAFIERRFS